MGEPAGTTFKRAILWWRLACRNKLLHRFGSRTRCLPCHHAETGTGCSPGAELLVLCRPLGVGHFPWLQSKEPSRELQGMCPGWSLCRVRQGHPLVTSSDSHGCFLHKGQQGKGALRPACWREAGWRGLSEPPLLWPPAFPSSAGAGAGPGYPQDEPTQGRAVRRHGEWALLSENTEPALNTLYNWANTCGCSKQFLYLGETRVATMQQFIQGSLVQQFLQALWPGAIGLTSLGLSFLFCNARKIAVCTSQGVCERMRYRAESSLDKHMVCSQ